MTLPRSWACHLEKRINCGQTNQILAGGLAAAGVEDELATRGDDRRGHRIGLIMPENCAKSSLHDRLNGAALRPVGCSTERNPGDQQKRQCHKKRTIACSYRHFESGLGYECLRRGYV